MALPERYFGTLLLLCALCVALCFQYLGASTLRRIPTWSDCDTHPQPEACLGTQAVLRTSSTLFAFFLACALISAVKASQGVPVTVPDATNGNEALLGGPGKVNEASDLDVKAGGVRLGLFAVLLVTLWSVPNAWFDDRGLAWVLRGAALVFILLQQIQLIDLAYLWNDAFVGYAGAGYQPSSGRQWLVSLLAASILLMALAVTAVTLLFLFFGPAGSGCGPNQAAISLALALPLCTTALQLTGDTGSLLTSAVVWAYSTFLCYSCVSSWPHRDCNPTFDETHDPLSIVLGLGLTLLSLGYTVFFASKNMAALLGDSASAGEAHSESMRVNLVLAFAAAYTGMLLTDWGSDGGQDAGVGKANFGVQFTAMLGAILLYGWTLVAPRLFPDREFV